MHVSFAKNTKFSHQLITCVMHGAEIRIMASNEESNTMTSHVHVIKKDIQ